MRIGCVILAGGEGRRIGGNKPLRMLGGKSLLDHVLAKVTQWQLPGAIAVRDAEQAGSDSGLPLLPDQEGAGPIAGLSAALGYARQAGFDAVLTLPCDTPFLPLDLPERLSAALAPPARAAAARSGGRLHPSCALWQVSAADLLPSYLAEKSSLTGFAEQLHARAVDWPIEDHDPFFNVNTEEDLAAAEHILKRG